MANSELMSAMMASLTSTGEPAPPPGALLRVSSGFENAPEAVIPMGI